MVLTVVTISPYRTILKELTVLKIVTVLT